MVGSNDGWSGEMTAQRKIEMVQTTQISVAKQGLTGWMDGWMDGCEDMLDVLEFARLGLLLTQYILLGRCLLRRLIIWHDRQRRASGWLTLGFNDGIEFGQTHI